MKRALAPSLFCALVLSVACSKDAPKQEAPVAAAVPAPSAKPAETAAQVSLKEGDAAPDVDFPLQDGRTVKLSSFRGKVVAVYFYPKDQTPGCTVEAQGIRDTWADLQKSGVSVIGVSAQDADSHKAFIEKEKLPYDLAVDTSDRIATAFGVPTNGGFHNRQTFLVGKDGKLLKIWRSVKPDGHASEILAAAKS